MKRLRMIAGPNGSGKTSLTNYLRSLPELDFGHYVNADEIQAALVKSQRVSFSAYDIAVDAAAFQLFYEAHPLFAQCEGAAFSIQRNSLRLNGEVPKLGYFSALLADFVRQQMLVQGATFSFETVMSDPDKIRLLQTAKDAGYRTYLYFVCTVDVLINIQRVADRVQKAGHDVPVDKITSRYERSLNLLWPAIQLSDRAYLFDNSGEKPELVLEITPDKKGIFTIGILPGWVRQHVLAQF